ncbi:MAG: MBL fold metallo-hydrolase [bacterium]
MRIKLIAVGSTKWERFIRKWGVSFLIGEDVLFDTFGNPGIFLSNIQRINIDLSRIKHIVISHDDWDHISGLCHITDTRKNIKVYICPDFAQESKEKIRFSCVNVIEANSLLKIKDEIYTTGQIYGESEGKRKPVYEQSLIVKSSKGLTIVTGCAHPGIINILDNVKKQFNENIYLVLGGLHLKDKTIGEIQEVLSKLKHYRVQKVAPLHCTGKRAEQLLKNAYNDNYISLNAGEVLEL